MARRAKPDEAISWYCVCNRTILQEIATAFGRAMTEMDVTGCINPVTWSGDTDTALQKRPAGIGGAVEAHLLFRLIPSQ